MKWLSHPLVKLILLVVALVALGYVITQNISIAEAWNQLREFSLWRSYKYLGLSVVMLLVKGLVFLILIESQYTWPNYRDLTLAIFNTQAIVRLPGGFAGRIAYLQQHLPYSLSKLSAVMVAYGFIDLVIPVVLSAILSLVYRTFIVYSLLTLMGLLTLFAIAMNRKLSAWLFEALPLNEDQQASANTFVKQLKHAMFVPGKIKLANSFLLALSIGLLTNLLGATQLWLLSRDLQAPLGFGESLFAHSSMYVVKLVFAFIPASAGAFEGAGILSLTRLEMDPTTASVVVLLLRVFTYLFFILLGAFTLTTTKLLGLQPQKKSS